MKTIVMSLATAAACCLVSSPSTARAQGFYLDANAGVSIAEDVKLKQFLGPANGKMKLDPGPRLAVAGGYNFTPYLGAQLETGFIANNIDRIGRSVEDATLSHIPLLADFVVRCDRGDWVPYLGIGAGGDISVISFDDTRVGARRLDGSESDLVFAWQAFAGARYKITETLSIGGGYKYFWADGAKWNVENSVGDIATKDAGVHSFGVDVNLKF